jgi:hypothetical protein
MMREDDFLDVIVVREPQMPKDATITEKILKVDQRIKVTIVDRVQKKSVFQMIELHLEANGFDIVAVGSQGLNKAQKERE